MKPTLLIAITCCQVAIASAQIQSTPKDDAPPTEYAAYLANLYTERLHFDAAQKQQAYDAILYKRRSLDSIKTNNVFIPTPALWELITYVDTRFRDILTPAQYTRYEDMRNLAIVRVPFTRLDSGFTR